MNPAEIPDPPEAPVWFDADQAYGFGCGWTAGYEAALAATAPVEQTEQTYEGFVNALHAIAESGGKLRDALDTGTGPIARYARLTAHTRQLAASLRSAGATVRESPTGNGTVFVVSFRQGPTPGTTDRRLAFFASLVDPPSPAPTDPEDPHAVSRGWVTRTLAPMRWNIADPSLDDWTWARRKVHALVTRVDGTAAVPGRPYRFIATPRPGDEFVVTVLPERYYPR